jgi:hypothetical protein
MSNELSTITPDDGFSIAEQSNSSSIVGRMLKFSDGQFLIDKTERLAAGSKLVANAVVTAWICWRDNKPVEHCVTQPGQRHPARDALPDLDQTEWPLGLNGEPNDPWKDTRYLHLIDRQTGTDLTFITDSFGGRRAIADLKSQIANVRLAHPSALPVVMPRSVPWKTKYGIKQRPQFEVVECIGRQKTEPDPLLSPARSKPGVNDPISTGRKDMSDDIPF